MIRFYIDGTTGQKDGTIVAIKPGAQVGNLYPQNLLNFSFTETELTS